MQFSLMSNDMGIFLAKRQEHQSLVRLYALSFFPSLLVDLRCHSCVSDLYTDLAVHQAGVRAVRTANEGHDTVDNKNFRVEHARIPIHTENSLVRLATPKKHFCTSCL